MRTGTGQGAIWRAGDFTGKNKPMGRATIQIFHVQTEKLGRHYYADYLFGQTFAPKELPNLKSIEYDRSTTTDAATCKIVLYNTQPLPMGTAVTPDDDGNYQYDQPGYFTFNRGLTTFTNRWHHTRNEWQAMLAPDRMIRTYEGYGFNPAVCPERDTNMTLSGVWIIDDVDYTADGLINVSCRDGGRLLLDQIMFPPVVPLDRYPLSFTENYPVANPPKHVSSSGWITPTYDTDSGVPYVGVNGNIHGHHPTDAFDSSYSTYWLSIGNAHPNADYAYEFIQGKFSASPVRYLKFTTWGGPYACYISVKVGGTWQGTAKVPYNPDSSVAAPNGSDIPYVKRITVGLNQDISVDLGKTYAGATAVRLCFHNLYNSQIGPYVYRAGVRKFQVTATATTTVPSGTHLVGNFGDYTDIVKQLLVWAGFHWNKSSKSTVTWSDGTKHIVSAPNDDPHVGSGRVWGDIESAGTGAIPGSVLGPTIWDKKPVMDGIAYVRDILGYIFWVDETGAAIFRSPNIWKVGCFVGDAAHGPSYLAGSANLITIDENETLIALDVSLSSKNQRERVFVANTTGKIGATAQGHIGKSGPFDANLRRVAGWTDQNFTKVSECQVMADLITLRQLFTYRTDKVTIPGYSAIQIDDQVRIIEGTTSEDFIHYISGLKSSWDIESGEWTYQLDTHWLGEVPFDNWAFNPASLSADTQTFLHATGVI